MNIYSIYTKDQSDNDDDNQDHIMIRQGFSFVAAIFNVLWALYYRMWLFAVVAFSVDIIPALFRYHHLYDEIAFVTRIGLAITFGFMAPEMREYSARMRGYKLNDIIAAASEAEAELKFFERSNTNFTKQKVSQEKDSKHIRVNPFAINENQ